nr:Histidine kinase [uncultured organism]
MTLAPLDQAQKRTPFWAWPAFDVCYLLAMFVTASVRGGGWDVPGPGLAALTLASWLPLLARRRYPEAVLLLVVAIEALHIGVGVSVGPEPTINQAMGAFQPVPLATMAAAFTLAVRRPGRAGWAPGLLAAVALLATGIAAHGRLLIATSFVAFDLVVIAVGAGLLVAGQRERNARDERDRQVRIRSEVVAERIRIAQDLHDVLAHRLTLVNAQAGVADYLLRTDAEAASESLRNIAGNTRLALDELRATVGMLRQDEPGPTEDLRPAPGLDRLDELIAGFRSAGAQVAVTVSGEPVQLPAGPDVAAYRIVQEAVTNATKHAPSASIDVQMHWRPGVLVLHITNTAPPGHPAGFQGPGTRHGLIGMRERALTAGGTLTSGPTSAGGYGVRASIPVRPVPQEPAS